MHRHLTGWGAAALPGSALVLAVRVRVWFRTGGSVGVGSARPRQDDSFLRAGILASTLLVLG